jgi:hypothetical protein
MDFCLYYYYYYSYYYYYYYYFVEIKGRILICIRRHVSSPISQNKVPFKFEFGGEFISTLFSVKFDSCLEDSWLRGREPVSPGEYALAFRRSVQPLV